MDKTTLLEKINKANITPELRADLVAMVNAAQTVDKDLLSKISATIDAEAENLIDEIANVELQVETDKYNQQMQGVSKDVDEFVGSLSKKADEIDLAAARKSIADA